MKQNEDTNGDIGHQNGPPDNLLSGVANSSGDISVSGIEATPTSGPQKSRENTTEPSDTTDNTNASNVEGQQSGAMEPEDIGCKYRILI